MKKNGLARQIIGIAILLITAIVLLILFIAWIVPKPPTEEFHLYHVMKITCNNVQPQKKALVYQAEYFRNKAYIEWQQQNEKFILKRDYTETERMILIAISIIEEAK
jgi:hypothetical protein